MADDFPEIPGFKILEMLGEGAMARVYLAVDESLDRKVALKIMLGSLAADVSFRERFLAEARDTAKFAHPGIVAIHTTGDHDGRYYLVLEYLESGTLKDHLKRKLSASADAQAETATGFTAREALVVTHQLAQALSYAHGKGVVHRDLKPANILFNDQGQAVLSDFGIAKSIKEDRELTQTGFAIGTPAYMSPEQKLGGAIDARSDLYSLGVVLWELLTGTKPYEVRSNNYLDLKNELQAEVPRLPDTLASLQPLIDRLIAKDPSERYGSAKEVIQAIEASPVFRGVSDAETVIQPRFEESEQATVIQPAAQPGTDGTVTVTQPIQTLLSRRWLIPAGASVLVALAAAVFFLLPDEPAVPEPTPVDAATAAQIEQLVERADLYVQSGWLIDPPGSNAVEALQRVIELQPGNREALDRLALAEDEVIALLEEIRQSGDAEAYASTLTLAQHYFPDSRRLTALSPDR